MKKISFNVELAKIGVKVQTADGRDVRIICYDRKCKDYPIVALVPDNTGTYENNLVYTVDGRFANEHTNEHLDLVMLVETKTIYINLYRTNKGLYYIHQDKFKDKDAARLTGKLSPEYIQTIEIEVEDL